MITVPTDHSCVATDVWPVVQTIHLSQKMSNIFCIFATDYSVVATDYLTVPTDHSYVATDDVTTVVWSVEQIIYLS